MPSSDPGKSSQPGGAPNTGAGAPARDFMAPDGELILPCMLGHYRVIRKLGKGGMGNVYLAEEQALNRQVAIKTLTQKLAGDPSYVRRFINEAQSIAKLVHPSIVGIYYIGRVQNLVFFAMEYVEGETVAERLAREKRLPLASVLSLGRQVCEALQCALEAGIVHRDIKPANLFIDRKGKIKVGDFGLAKSQESDLSLTQAGSVVGSPYYMSPEQGCGRKVDHRSDIYSLGATLYHLAAGQPPFAAETAVEMVMRHVQDTLQPIGILPSGPRELFHSLIAKMMAKSAEERFQTYPEYIQAIAFLQRTFSGKAPLAPAGAPAATMVVASPAPSAAEGLAPAQAKITRATPSTVAATASIVAPIPAPPGATASDTITPPPSAAPAMEASRGSESGATTVPASAIAGAKPAGAGWRVFAIVLLVALTVVVTVIAIKYQDFTASKKDRQPRPTERANPIKAPGKAVGHLGAGPGGKALTPDGAGVQPTMATSEPIPGPGMRPGRFPFMDGISSDGAKMEPGAMARLGNPDPGRIQRPTPGPGAPLEIPRKDRPIKNAMFRQMWENLEEDLRDYYFSAALIKVENLMDKSRDIAVKEALKQHAMYLKSLADLKTNVIKTINDNLAKKVAIEVSAGRKVLPFEANSKDIIYSELRGGGKSQQLKSDWAKALRPVEFLTLANGILPNNPDCNRQIRIFAHIYNLEPEYLVIEQFRPVETQPVVP